MFLAAKYAPRKNLEKIHIRQIRPKISWNFAQKWLNWANPGLFIVKDYFLRKSINHHGYSDHGGNDVAINSDVDMQRQPIFRRFFSAEISVEFRRNFGGNLAEGGHPGDKY